jgi:hypothetical protein
VTGRGPETEGGVEIPSEPSPWRRGTVVGVVVAAVFMSLSFVAWRLLLHPQHGWFVPGDVWQTVRGAQFVGDGALGYIYENHPGPELPLFPILLAPFYLAGRAMNLTVADPFGIPHPTMWLVIGPPGLLSAIPVLAALRGMTRRLGFTISGRTELGLVLGALFPIYVFAHFEDAFALAFVMLALWGDHEDEQDRSAFALAVAVSFKQWAILALPVFLFARWRTHRLRSLAIAASLPAVLAAFPLAVDWAHASRELLSAPTYPEFGHTALWVVTHGKTIVTTPARMVLIVVTVLLASRVRRGPTDERVVAAVAAVFLARTLFEPVLHTYYLAPGVAFALVLEWWQRRSVWRAATLGFVLTLYGYLHPWNWLWWSGYYLGAAALLWAPLVTILSRRRDVEVPTPVS